MSNPTVEGLMEIDELSAHVAEIIESFAKDNGHDPSNCYLLLLGAAAASASRYDKGSSLVVALRQLVEFAEDPFHISPPPKP